jgi:hypothetical protein
MAADLQAQSVDAFETGNIEPRRPFGVGVDVGHHVTTGRRVESAISRRAGRE